MNLILFIGLLLVGYGQSTSESFEFPDEAASPLYDFSFDLYNKLSKHWGPNKNVVLSPLSVYCALAILEPGLGGESRLQVERAMHADELENPAKDESRLFTRIFRKNEDYKLNRANRIFVDTDVQLLKKYKKSALLYQKAAVRKLDFSNSTAARREINKFVNGHTNKEIRNFLKEGSITDNTVMFLVNAMSLKAGWNTPFLEEETRDKDFHMTSSETISVPTMLSYDGKCIHEDLTELGSEIVVIPFANESLSAIFVMPKEAGDFSVLEGSNGGYLLKNEFKQIWRRERSPFYRTCVLTLPKFEVKHSVGDLKSAFRELGIVDVLSEETADFTPMTRTEGLYVSDAKHEAALKIDEEGIKASAATSIGISSRMARMRVSVNKPFLFIIRHEGTGSILFMGRVVDPRSK